MNTSNPCGFGKPDRKQRESRLVVVEEMRYRRLMSADQIERALSAEWGVNKRTIRGYMQRVRERMAIQAQHDPERLSRQAVTEAMLSQYQEVLGLAALAAEKGEISTALRGRRDAVKALTIVGEFHGLRVQRHELTGPNGTPLTLTPEQAADELRKIVEEVAAQKASDPPANSETPPAGAEETTE